MKSRWLAFVGAFLLFQPAEAQYRAALPGYHYEFPRDYFNHPDYQTEWWYYTGNLKAPDGHHFGFELTFFRQALSRDSAKSHVWDLRDVYFAHLAVSDLDNKNFYHSERTNRAGPGIAGASEENGRIWNGNWQIQWHGGDQELQGIGERFQLHLTLHSQKPPVIHGENGVSQKAAGRGHASHYISLTRLDVKGDLELDGKKFHVTGLAWMDHEFFTHQMGANQAGWDWLSMQFDDYTELMLYRIRKKDGSIDTFSAGTYVDAQGKSFHLRAADFTLQPSGESWTSPTTHAVYPIHWKISVPALGIDLRARTPLASQELTGNSPLIPNYWEGAITLSGHQRHAALSGVGYLEMTGYDHAVDLGP